MKADQGPGSTVAAVIPPFKFRDRLTERQYSVFRILDLESPPICKKD